ncbi:MAG: ethanolamine utilization protein EutH [Ruminococcaceae bacterium]|nr:ethanolamine utilization protein EutH [Oscillospiraceae bacterium]
MGVNEIIIYLMLAFMVLGAIDRILGNRFGLGAEFENGILAMGSLALAMLGIIALSPVLASLLNPVLVPVFRLFRADPAMFAGTILACDMGGASLAQDLAQSPEAALFGGILVGSTLGPTIVFNIPVALGIIPKEDQRPLAQGILFGLLTIPVGCFFGGLVAGFSIAMIVQNLIPILLIALLIALGLWRAENAMIRGFTIFGKVIIAIITLGLAAGIIEQLTGFAVIPGMAPLSDGFATVGAIAIVLAGAFPLVFVITRLFKKPLTRLGSLLGMNDVAAAGLVATLANSIPMFGMMKDMDRRGKILNVAFAVSASFVFGDHLGFTAGFAPEMLTAMIVGKLAGGISAVAVAMLATRRNSA